MKVLNTSQIREWDAYTIEHEPILSIDLMERASQRLFEWIKKHYFREEMFIIFAGSGNNGGDAMALARHLYNGGFTNVQVHLLHTGKELSKDCQINYTRLSSIDKIPVTQYNKNDAFPDISDEAIVIDGIFGSGLSRPVTGYWGEFIKHINSSSSEIVSIDVPSGIFCEDNTSNNGEKIKAQITLTFQIPKLSFLFADNQNHIGTWFTLDIGLHEDFQNKVDSPYHLTSKENIKDLLKERYTFNHKGTFGHGFLIAGSLPKMGAAVLSAKGALRSGIGLLTVHVPQSGRVIMQTAIPEAMLCIDESEQYYCSKEVLSKYSAIGIGPGIGLKKSVQNALKTLLDNNNKPIVIDADALNILAQNKEWLPLLKDNTIITPHPGEFDRLTKKHNTAYERFMTQIELSKKLKIIIVLKGAFTSITDSMGNVYFNLTGNPGMATAGSGDVLTGIIVSLLAQNYRPIDAARVGVYLHGLAGDIAASENGYDALIASDIIDNLGKGFKKTFSPV